VALGIWAVRSHETILISVLKDFSTHQDQKSSFVELRRASQARPRVMHGVGIGKRETKTAKTSSTCRVMNRIRGPSVIWWDR
jgi:hypothetical protein